MIAGNGRLALLYDTIEHLDGAHQRFALDLPLARESRAVRLRMRSSTPSPFRAGLANSRAADFEATIDGTLALQLYTC